MRPDLQQDVRRRLGTWATATEMTHRRGSRVLRLEFSDHRTVAVKVACGDGHGPAPVLPAREAAVLTAIDPAAGTVLGSGWLTDGGSWMATQWWQGPNLTQCCAAIRTDPDHRTARTRAAAAAAAAAQAVAALHARGWAHGDLQADHIIRTTTGVRLLDLAWAHNPDHVLPEILTRPYAGALVHLEPPEIAAALLDGVPVHPTAPGDVYSLAGAIWTSCSGYWPLDYQAAGVDPRPGSPVGKRRAAAAGILRPASSFPWPALADLLHGALARHPEQRPTAAELAAGLDALSTEGGIRDGACRAGRPTR